MFNWLLMHCNITDRCKHFLLFYIFYSRDKVILGGIRQENDWRTVIDEYDKEKILRNNSKVLPGIEVTI